MPALPLLPAPDDEDPQNGKMVSVTLPLSTDHEAPALDAHWESTMRRVEHSIWMFNVNPGLLRNNPTNEGMYMALMLEQVEEFPVFPMFRPHVSLAYYVDVADDWEQFWELRTEMAMVLTSRIVTASFTKHGSTWELSARCELFTVCRLLQNRIQRYHIQRLENPALFLVQNLHITFASVGHQTLR